MKKSLKIISPLFILFALFSCYDNSDCFTENVDQAKVEFRTDSIIYQFDLPLNPLADTASYIIDTMINVPITIIYERKQRLLHPDCGMETVYEIDTALTPLSNNVRIVKKELKKPISKNIEVFL